MELIFLTPVQDEPLERSLHITDHSTFREEEPPRERMARLVAMDHAVFGEISNPPSEFSTWIRRGTFA